MATFSIPRSSDLPKLRFENKPSGTLHRHNIDKNCFFHGWQRSTAFVITDSSTFFKLFEGLFVLNDQEPIVIYNAGAVDNYKASSSQVRFENKHIFFYFVKTLQPTMYVCTTDGKVGSLRIIDI
jgi:hypothetical protein